MKSKIILLALLCIGVCLGAQLNVVNPAQVYISVNVTGFVPNPGTYQVTPVNRLSDALNLTKSTINRPQMSALLTPQQTVEAVQDSLYQNFQGLRSVKLTRGKNTTSYDLLKFLRTGDLSQNPLLKDGDVIHVSPIHKSVSVLGEVYLPGEYEFVEGDKLSDILALAQGSTLGGSLKSINIYRYKDNMTDFDLIRVDLRSANAESFALQAHDRIIVTQDAEYRREWKITVEGKVKAPGVYLIGENTTLYDILVQSGGPTSRGDLRGAIYANGTYTSEPDPEFERLKLQSLTQMTTMEYQYMRNRMRQFPGKYSVEVAKVWESQGASGNPVLRDGDYLYVPENLDMVAVSGQVVNPGLIPWVDGKTWDYYVQKAGGYTNNKRYAGTRIISSASGNWVKPSKKVLMNPGDTIFVAEKNEHDFWTDVKDVLLITSQVVTIFLGIRAVTTN